MKKEKVLVAGATGYLGQYLVKELKKRNHWVRVLIRKEEQKKYFTDVDDYFIGQITDSKTLKTITNNIDYVYSTVGITRQKDGLTYMDVDYQGNLNLLNETKATGVKSFLYVSAVNGDKLRHLKIFEAKERFVDELKNSGLDYKIIRPNGFFSDMGDFLKMAKGGKVYLFGDGEYRLNPIHGEDLAEACVDSIQSTEKEIIVGGPDLLSQNKIGELALKAYKKPIKVIHLPDWIRRFIIWATRTFTSSKTYGPIEFFLTSMDMDMITPEYGKYRLQDYFAELVTQN